MLSIILHYYFLGFIFEKFQPHDRECLKQSRVEYKHHKTPGDNISWCQIQASAIQILNQPLQIRQLKIQLVHADYLVAVPKTFETNPNSRTKSIQINVIPTVITDIIMGGKQLILL